MGITAEHKPSAGEYFRQSPERSDDFISLQTEITPAT
jgi:hypothetical protein